MRSRHLLAAACLLLVAGGCTVTDETVVVAISTLAPSLVDSDLAGQAVEVGVLPDQGTIQNVRFNDITILLLTFDEFESDMTFEQADCQFFDVWNNTALALGKCASGVVVDGDEQSHVMSLQLQIESMVVQRVPPLFLPPSGDYDVDGVLNSDDNCVLIDNPDQTDTGVNGFGDACSTLDLFTGRRLLDSDADSVADNIDNCPYTPNPNQEDSGIILDGNLRVPDGIGNACITEEATVRLNGSTTIEFEKGPLEEVLPLRRVRWLTVDFKDQIALESCWAGGSCELNPSQVDFCLDQNGGFGCP